METLAKMLTDANSHAEFDAWLGDRGSRKVAHNTYAERVGDDGDIAIRLHATRVVTFHTDGTLTLNSGGWRTVTTKDRICSVIRPKMDVSSRDGVWTVSRSAGAWPTPRETVSEFYDGMRLTADGEMVTAVLIDSGRAMKQAKREIGAYVKLYTDERIRELIADAMENGTAGDCFFCSMVTADGETLGDSSQNVDHLREHVREGYVMASLAANAVKSRGYREPAVILHHSPDSVRRAIRAYLVEKLTVSHGARPVRNGLAQGWA